MPTEAEFLALKTRISRLSIDDPDPDCDPALSLQILQPLAGGNKIEAIKIYCGLTGAGQA